MPSILYGRSAYRRENGSLPEFRLINMFVEQTPSAETGTTLLSRPGLTDVSTVGVGPVEGVFSQPGTFGGDLFTVTGNVLYRGDTELGPITGSGPVSWAASGTEVLVTRGGPVYSYNGTNLANAGFVGLSSNNVTSIAFLAGLFVAVEAGSHRWFWSGVNNGRSWDVLDFASAESAPDTLLDSKAVGPYLFLLGQKTIEVWTPGGPVEVPFSRIEGRLYRKGVISTGCADEQDNALTVIGSDGIVYRIADVPQRISDHGIEERIEESASARAFTFIYEGHNFFCIRLDEGTWAYDAATGQWCELQSFGRDNFRAQCATMVDRAVVLGDDETGTIWGFSGHQDGADPLIRLFTAAFPVKGGSVFVDNLVLISNPGSTPFLIGQGSDPLVEIRASRTQGRTWGTWRATSLGQQGRYASQPVSRRWGTYGRPGAMFEIRTSDPVPFRVTDVLVNEPLK
jgi:hypothetical protein